MVSSCTRSVFGRCGACRITLVLLSGICIFAAATAPVLAQTSGRDHAASVHPLDAHVAEASQRFGIPATWIGAVMRAESGGNMRALSSAGAMGLMQVMPGTWAELRRRYGLGHDPYDPRANILAGTAYLREMWDRYGNVAAMLAAYNAGPARYDDFRASARPLPAETRAYVASLAPVLHGEQSSGSASAVVRPRDWREAPIFVVQEDGASATDPRLHESAPDDAPPHISAVQETLTALQPEGLFVARGAYGGRP